MFFPSPERNHMLIRIVTGLTAALLLFPMQATVAQDPAQGPPGTCANARIIDLTNYTWMTQRAKQTPAKWNLPRQFEHVLIVVLENQDYDQVVKNSYIKNLAARGVRFSNFNGSFHPSYANYLAMIGGRYFGSSQDDQINIDSRVHTIADLLEAKSLTWKQYAERYPGNCFKADFDSTRLYARKHVPFMSFASIQDNPARCANVVSTDGFDARHLPNYAFFTPDMCDDGHNQCPKDSDTVAQAAAWLKDFIEPLLADPAVTKDTLIVVTFDESASYEHNHILTIFLGDMVKTGHVESGCYDHYNVLRTIEDNFGAGTLGAQDEKSSPITSVWKPAPGASPAR
jgi:hypothetical protein